MIRFLGGDCRAVLPTLPDRSVQCVVTSPPYFGLRDYGTGTWEDGDPACDHVNPSGAPGNTHSEKSTLTTNGGRGPQVGDKYSSGAKTAQFRDVCGRCGAIRVDSQIGLEASPALYVAEMVAVFREVRRVLRDDGTVWLNIGDSYNNFRVSKGPGQAVHGRDKLNRKPAPDSGPRGHDSFKEKDLMMIPARVAIALCDDGWYLRSDIIWAKPNPMPESVTDRPTSSHEHIFLLTKRPTYFYDADAIREDREADSLRRWDLYGGNPSAAKVNPDRRDQERFGSMGFGGNPDGRNARNVWTIATQPFSSAHFATFPPALVERCIKAGSKVGDTILDPFSGAGTTALVADRLGRDAIGIDLNPTYGEMARNRLIADAGLFAEFG